MRQLLAVVLLLSCGGVIAAPAAQPRVADPAYLATIVDDDPNPLPRHLADHERALLRSQSSINGGSPPPVTPPPSGPVRSQAEYEPNQGILIRWGSYNALHTAMTVPLTTAAAPSTVYVVVSSAAAQTSASSVLSGGGADMNYVKFIVAPSDSVWIRDYGPRYVQSSGKREIVDHQYNRPRPNDDLFPQVLGPRWNERIYDIPLEHGGGNFHLFRNRDAFLTRLIANENPSLTNQQIVDYYLAYQGLNVTLTDAFPACYDSTQHIDMWMLPLADNTVLIGEYAATEGCAGQPGTTGVPKTVSDATAALMASRGYAVYRTPGWRTSAHFTYTNAVISNQTVLICRFGGSNASRDAQALATFQTAMPNHAIVQVDCSGIIGQSGAIHCIVMHVPDLAFREGYDAID